MSSAKPPTPEDALHLLEACQTEELTSAERGEAHPRPHEHLLALLLTDDLQEARHFWRRLPEDVRTPLTPLWTLAQPLFRKNYTHFFKAVRTCAASTPSHIQPLLVALQARTRARAVTLIERVYSVVSAARCAGMLGVERDELADVCRVRGWVVEGDFVLCGDATTADGKANNNAFGNQQGNRDAGSRTGEECIGSREGGGRLDAPPFTELQTLTEQLVRLQTS